MADPKANTKKVDKKVINLSKKTFVVKSGDRVAQMILCPVIKASLKEVANLPKSFRGKGGFGSTGK